MHNLCGLFVNEYSYHPKKLFFFLLTKPFHCQGNDHGNFYSIQIFYFSATMGEIYAEYKDEDSFLYIAYGGENTFG